MIKLEQTPGYIIAFLLGLPIGFFVYNYVVNYLQFQVAKEVTLQIDPWNTISILVSVILAAIVLRKLNNKDENDKTERELIISYFSNFDSEFTDKIRNASMDGVPYNHTVNMLKRYGVRFESIAKLAIEQGFLKEDSETVLLLKRKIRLIKIFLTDTPTKEAPVDDGIKVVDGKLFFSEKQKDKIAYAIYDINCTIFLLIVEMNRSSRN